MVVALMTLELRLEAHSLKEKRMVVNLSSAACTSAIIYQYMKPARMCIIMPAWRSLGP